VLAKPSPGVGCAVRRVARANVQPLAPHQAVQAVADVTSPSELRHSLEKRRYAKFPLLPAGSSIRGTLLGTPSTDGSCGSDSGGAAYRNDRSGTTIGRWWAMSSFMESARVGTQRLDQTRIGSRQQLRDHR